MARGLMMAEAAQEEGGVRAAAVTAHAQAVPSPHMR